MSLNISCMNVRFLNDINEMQDAYFICFLKQPCPALGWMPAYLPLAI